MNAQDCSFSLVEVGIRDRSKTGRILFRNCYYFVPKFLSMLCHSWKALLLVKSCIVGEYVGTSVAYKVVNVLPINSLVQDVNVLALPPLNFCNRLYKPFILANSFPIPEKICH